MMWDGWFGGFGAFGMASIGAMLILLGRLSERLGRVTHARSYHIGFFAAAFLIGVGVAARLAHLIMGVALRDELQHNIFWILIYNGAPAVGVTLGLVFAWRYWSWLLAERD
jgi:hypothetical protein